MDHLENESGMYCKHVFNSNQDFITFLTFFECRVAPPIILYINRNNLAYPAVWFI